MLSSAAAAEPTGNWQFQKTFSFLAFCLLIERGRNVVHKKVSFFSDDHQVNLAKEPLLEESTCIERTAERKSKVAK